MTVTLGNESQETRARRSTWTLHSLWLEGRVGRCELGEIWACACVWVARVHMAAAGCKRENALVEINDASERGVGERERCKRLFITHLRAGKTIKGTGCGDADGTREREIEFRRDHCHLALSIAHSTTISCTIITLSTSNYSSPLPSVRMRRQRRPRSQKEPNQHLRAAQ